MKSSFIFPGQGSQVVGMMADLASHYDIVQSLYEEASDALGVDLWKMTQEGPIEQLSLTENTQPALLTAGVAAWQIWQQENGSQPVVMAGHSLGEYTALVCAGAIPFAQGVALVRDRGRYMQGAVPAGEGAMAAILGLEDEQVKQACAQASQHGAVQAVNFNAPGQVVIAGTTTAIEHAIVLLKEAGARRAMPLPVSIPAHSSLMKPAASQLAERLESIDVSLPEIPVIHNFDVQIADSADKIRQNLVAQLDGPVRWVETVEKMNAEGIERYIESGPGKVLSGMVKRIVKGANVACIETKDSLTATL